MGVHHLAENVFLNIILCIIKRNGDIYVYILNSFQRFNQKTLIFSHYYLLLMFVPVHCTKTVKLTIVKS